MRIVIMKMLDIHSEIQTGIINYLSIHPTASASAQRICNQWLANERYSHNIDQVQTAINGLVARGEIHKHSNADIYTL
ncbi:hypothetical protein CPS_2620 [Colwellia psychrerythraea 34H]|uniref:Uncharacterized protein n=2 Tax=Colwelliaceae TaxID=267889 RepID=Q481D5_COLP3|nr:hypothetical protein CPS_2620 [Colwellia psychrerythraea 34H]